MAKQVAKHTHLDRQRRERGICPACDVQWEAQDARLAGGTERQLPTKPAPVPPSDDLIPPGGWTRVAGCAAMHVGRGGTWICNRSRNHSGQHHCPLHDLAWS